jgi:23S rRNA maturation-related 3'-5' exoribonuclease YhaM
MIRNITGGMGIHVTGSVYNAPYIDTTRASAGMVRYVGGNFEVYDGSSWLPLQSSYPTIELDGVTQEAIQWTRRRMEEEKRMLELAKNHPTVADALAAVKKAQEQLDIVVTMVTV